MGSLLHHDEELAAGGVGVHGTGHGQHAPVVEQVVLEAVLGELALDGVAGTAHAGALGAAALDHKPRDAAMEDKTVIKPLLDEADEVVDAVGRHIGVKLGFDDAAIFHFDGDDGILSHGYHPFLCLIIGFGSSLPGPSPAWHPAWRRIPACHRASCPWQAPPPA